jgi:hypothetical protein
MPWKICSILEELQEFVHICCAIFTKIVCLSDDGERSLQNVLQTCRFVPVTFSRKSSIVAAVFAD